ncbi:MAG: Hvo_1808 family surface protein [Halobacteriales archaeon]|nr:Hvo_1808 family surface protein [Halobacteriales archaeon]
MRARSTVLLVVLVALAGCSVGYSDSTPTGETTPTSDSVTATPTPSDAATPTPATDLPDPETDRLGWENGYWANETLAVDRSDGLDETERDRIIARAMARVETVRQLEFSSTVPVELMSREEYQNSQYSGGGERSAAFKAFDNAKFEGLFLVGENEDSLAVQESNRGSSVAGFYTPRNDRIVVIYGGETADLPGERTLGHELTHALQDQQFNLSTITASTREQSNAQNGLIEGGASLTEERYMANCGDEWECLSAPQSGSGAGGSDLHLGIYIMNFFPYDDGPAFVEFYQERGGWDRINQMYDDLPASTEQVAIPEKYAVNPDPPTDVSLSDATTNGWERVDPPERNPTARLGQSAMTAMFGYTLYAGTGNQPVIQPQELLNLDSNGNLVQPPFKYTAPPVRGWDGDRMHIYQKNNETAYVWKSVWDSPQDAAEFADAYADLLAYWGGSQQSGGVYVIESGAYADAFRVTVDGDTVTIVNAPTTDDLPDVHE